jgi:serine/threonine protein kinase
MLVPDLIGRYRLGPRLGSGGFAVVWLAHDESLDTDIAIKVMAENWADRMDLRERFLMEARMLRRAASNRIVQVFDIGELPDGRPYFVMEYADRGTLADRVRVEPLPVVVALRVTAEIARGAAELHRAGIVHRDLKPSNVLIRSTQDGPERLLIADLGVAKNLAQASGVTMSVGSAGYMAPEQSGPNSGVDVRADVYSLAAIAYRLITGEVPGLPGFVRWDDAALGLPIPVRKLLQQAMEVDRERRWPDATSLAVELDRLADQLAAPAPVAAPPRRRRRVASVVGGLVAVAVLAAIGYGVYDYRQPVPVQDKTNRISLEVPRAWAKESVSSDWDPKTLKLTGDRAPGLVVADDVQRWPNLTTKVNGVFVGLSTDPELSKAIGNIKHSNCKPAKDVGGYKRTPWQGQVHSWEHCDGTDRSIQEISLERGSDRVYVQIRRSSAEKIAPDAGNATTIRILDSLEISD